MMQVNLLQSINNYYKNRAFAPRHGLVTVGPLNSTRLAISTN